MKQDGAGEIVKKERNRVKRGGGEIVENKGGNYNHINCI